jgi:hypothetical protein
VRREVAAQLVSYGDLEAGAAIWWATVERDAATGEWIPRPLPEMPRHHATRLEWTNLASFPEAASAKTPLRFTFRIVSREIEQMTATRWNALYRAELVAVCPP